MPPRWSFIRKIVGDVRPSPSSWRPVALVQVDVGATQIALPEDVEPGDRLWVEAIMNGQVVAIFESRAQEEGLSTSFLRDLATSLADVKPSEYASVPDELLARATVVVPTICENPARLLRTVEALLELDYPDFEIIIVDNRPGADRPPLPGFPDDARVRVSAEPKRGVAAARNRGAADATGDFVAFTDDDAVVDKDWLRVLGSRFALDAEVEGIGGLVLPLEIDTPPQLWFEEFYGGFSQSFDAEIFSIQRLKGVDELFPYAPGRFGAGNNMAFRRSTLQRIGGFNVCLGTGTPARGGEDLAIFVDLLLAGGTTAFEPAALVRHSHRRTEHEFMHQVFGYGVGLTATYVAMIAGDPKHLIAMIKRVPGGVRLLTRPRDQRSPSSTPSYPRRTIFYQVLGMAFGPVAYLRSVVRDRWGT